MISVHNPIVGWELFGYLSEAEEYKTFLPLLKSRFMLMPLPAFPLIVLGCLTIATDCPIIPRKAMRGKGKGAR